MQVSLTGNPFVDTGLAVIATLAGCKNISDLTVDLIRHVHGNGEHLASINFNLRCTEQVFGKNSVILQNSFPPEKRLLYYGRITTSFLNNIGFEDIQERCESCGHRLSLDLDKIIRNELVPLGYSKGKRYIGRDWFPLAGSLTNDAQSLPAASRPVNLCAKCLFAVHYLPQGAIIVNRKLTIFQSTSLKFWYSIVNTNTSNMQKKIIDGNFQTHGSVGGTVSAIQIILNVMHEMQEDLEPGTSLFMWMFSNSGIKPYCTIEEIPNSALSFIFEAIRHVQRSEIIDIVSQEDKKHPEYLFLNCISKGIDYYPIYYRKDLNGVSTKLYSLYQVCVCGVSVKSLEVAFMIAKYAYAKKDKKEFERIRKDIANNLTNQNIIRKEILLMVNENLLKYDEFFELFLNSVDDRILRLNRHAWKLIQYYMYNLEHEPYNPRITAPSSQVSPRNSSYDLRYHYYVASTIFSSFVKDKGIDRFRNEVLDGLSHERIGIGWLRNRFANLAQEYDGFTYDAWKYICVSYENGYESLYDLLFIFRILWTEWLIKMEDTTAAGIAAMESIPMTNNRSYTPLILPQTIIPQLHNDLSEGLKSQIVECVRNYIDEYGLLKFRSYVIEELMNDGLRVMYWLRNQLSRYDTRHLEDDFWEDGFLYDREGNDIKYLRYFQVQLLINNLLKDQQNSYNQL